MMIYSFFLFYRFLPAGSAGSCFRIAEAGIEPGGYPYALGMTDVVSYPGATGG